jgi:hypothetical protein
MLAESGICLNTNQLKTTVSLHTDQLKPKLVEDEAAKN